MKTLPVHGPIECRRCFDGSDSHVATLGRWQIVNDPGAWGASVPKILVLGFSKGSLKPGPIEQGGSRTFHSRGCVRA